MSQTVKLSDYIFHVVAAQGVRHVFFLPGGGAMHLVDSLGHTPGLEPVCTLHEQGASVAAEAYARVTGGLGAVLVTTGPGGTNAVTGLAAAWQDSTPVLFISGQVKRADLIGDLGLRQRGVQEIDIISVVKPLTKYAVTVMEPERIRYHLEKALYLARTGRPGPVWIDVPLDVQAAMIDPQTCRGFDAAECGPPRDSAALQAQVRETLALLAEAERPVLLGGNGIRLAGAIEEFRALADMLDLPVLLSPLGLDLLPDAHPLVCGRPGGLAPRGANFTLQNADWLLVLGSRLDMAMTAYDHRNFARAAKKIMVDVDPAELAKMGDTIHLPVCADVGDFIREFRRQYGGMPCDRSAWRGRCREWKEKYPLVLPEYRAQSTRVNTYHFSDVLTDELASDDVIASGSSGVSIELFLLVFRVKAGQRVFHNRGTGAMGLGLPAAIGACLASGRRRTVSVDGDGGFQMNIQELATVARLGLPVKYFVLSNDGYGSIRQMQRGYFQGRFVGCDVESGLAVPDLLKVAEAYGLATARITDHTDLRDRVRAVLDAPGPVVCEVLVTRDEPRAPRVTSTQRPDGTMVSRPLEDLWPLLDREEFRANMLVPPLDQDAPSPSAVPSPTPARVGALVLDFDGVFTDNKVVVFQDGREAVLCDRSDGLGLARLRDLGFPLLVLSTETNPVVEARCRKLRIPCLQGVQDKLSALTEWAESQGLSLAEIVYVGNDVNDLACLRAVGCGVAVQDAYPEVRRAADYVLSACGGQGALREVAELVEQWRDRPPPLRTTRGKGRDG